MTEQYFTGNKDVDLDILLSLRLQDVEQMCSTNTYIHSLCNNMAMKRKLRDAQTAANNLINLNRDHYTFMFIKEYPSFRTIIPIIKYLNMKEYHNKIIDDYSDDKIDGFRLIRRGNDYMTVLESYEEDELAFMLNKQQTILLLIHLIYNNMLLRF